MFILEEAIQTSRYLYSAVNRSEILGCTHLRYVRGMYAGLGIINAKLQTFSHVNTAGPWEAVLNQFAKWA